MLPKAKETLKRVVDIRKLPKFIGKEPKNDMFKGGDMKIAEEKVVVPTFLLYKLIKLMLQAKNELVTEANAGKSEHLILEVQT